ncbi:MAG: ATP phosphoribosyltransferase [Aestuariivita sp.]|nr:ATP phosphoribosyltransferase [Aestuariivita sp.]
MTLKLGIPSKGRLMSQTFDWLMKRGIRINRIGSERTYSTLTEDIDGLTLVLLSAGEIPRELSAGRLHLGVTGTDLIHEKLPLRERQVKCLMPLNFGKANLVIAVPKFWIDVDSLDDLDAAAADFRARYGIRLRIATQYHRLVRDFLSSAGVADYSLVDSQGATEGAIKNEIAEAIADITSTGETLRANHLKVLSDGLILKSEATLWQSQTALLSKEDKQLLLDFMFRTGIE